MTARDVIAETLAEHRPTFDYDVSYNGPVRCLCGVEVDEWGLDRWPWHERHQADMVRAALNAETREE